jgi:hypothetical protein
MSATRCAADEELLDVRRHVVCCMLHVACFMLYVACCMLYVTYCCCLRSCWTCADSMGPVEPRLLQKHGRGWWGRSRGNAQTMRACSALCLRNSSEVTSWPVCLPAGGAAKPQWDSGVATLVRMPSVSASVRPLVTSQSTEYLIRGQHADRMRRHVARDPLHGARWAQADAIARRLIPAS